MEIFRKQNGAVSVFLTLVLIPVILFACLTFDAVKIYSSKVILSDAGDMSLNAALAGYDQLLLDKYGLLAMEKSPDSIKSDLETYFEKSLASIGIEGANDYSTMLKMVKSSFDSIGVANTEIFRSEVEKQQIVEYMKYRAPVCLTEEVLEKIGLLKDTKKVSNAVEKELDFAESMNECQDAFVDALNELEKLNTLIEAFPRQSELETMCAQARQYLTGPMAKYLLLVEGGKLYSRSASQQEAEAMLDRLNDYTIDMEMDYSPINEDIFDDYVMALESLNALLDIYDELDESQQSQVDSYERRIITYQNVMISEARDIIIEYTDPLSEHYKNAKKASTIAANCVTKLDYVSEKLIQASNSFNSWDNATSELDSSLAGDMPNHVNEYRTFFNNGSDDPRESVALLRNACNYDIDYFKEIYQILEQERLFDKRLAVDTADVQLSAYESKAEAAMRGQEFSISQIERVRQENFSAHYNHTDVETTVTMSPIKDEPFFLTLREYCANQDSTADTAKGDEESGKLNESSGKTDGVGDNDAPDYNFSNSEKTLPSSKIAAEKEEKKNSLSTLGSDNDINDSGDRKDIISKIKDSISNATSFLNGLDEIFTHGITNLYVAEYAMQMFSHYNVDKKMNAHKQLDNYEDKDILSLSGYELSGSPAYRGEIEYIIWGNHSTKANITSTLFLLFGIRLVFNSVFVFTNLAIRNSCMGIAGAICGPAQFLTPVVTVLLQLIMALAESLIEVTYLKDGYGVVVLKDETTFASYIFPSTLRYGPDVVKGSTTNSLTLDYGEYLRVFLNIQMLVGKENSILTRIGDCIQINIENDLTSEYTMAQIDSTVKVKTVFMKKISDYFGEAMSETGVEGYSLKYKGVLGY